MFHSLLTDIKNTKSVYWKNIFRNTFEPRMNLWHWKMTLRVNEARKITTSLCIRESENERIQKVDKSLFLTISFLQKIYFYMQFFNILPYRPTASKFCNEKRVELYLVRKSLRFSINTTIHSLFLLLAEM